MATSNLEYQAESKHQGRHNRNRITKMNETHSHIPQFKSIFSLHISFKMTQAIFESAEIHHLR